MKAFTTYSCLVVLMLSLLGCSGSSSSKETILSPEEAISDTPKYTADVSNMVLQWTAYKFTEKLGVSGVFDDFSLSEKSNPGTIEELLVGTKMIIVTASINSNNEIRDPKLRADFFKVFNTEFITARILNAESGQGTMELTMNKISNELNYVYFLKSDTLFLNTSLDLLLWKGKQSMDSLNRVCYDLHKGADGISKLWPDVDVSLKIPVK